MAAKANIALFAALLISSMQELSADTLFKKKAAVAIGFGETGKSEVRWANCSRQDPKTYVKPPYWIDKSDNCRITANDFGLSASGQLYLVRDVNKSSLFFPDVKAGKVVGFKIDSAAGFVLLTFGFRSLRLPYAAPVTEEQAISNELSVAEGFVNIGEGKLAGDLLEDTDQSLRVTPVPLFSTAFIMDASVSLFRIKALSPRLSEVSHSSLLQLAYLRSALEKAPEV
jgi:hypothetical protein